MDMESVNRLNIIMNEPRRLFDEIRKKDEDIARMSEDIVPDWERDDLVNDFKSKFVDLQRDKIKYKREKESKKILDSKYYALKKKYDNENRKIAQKEEEIRKLKNEINSVRKQKDNTSWFQTIAHPFKYNQLRNKLASLEEKLQNQKEFLTEMIIKTNNLGRKVDLANNNRIAKDEVISNAKRKVQESKSETGIIQKSIDFIDTENTKYEYLVQDRRKLQDELPKIREEIESLLFSLPSTERFRIEIELENGEKVFYMLNERMIRLILEKLDEGYFEYEIDYGEGYDDIRNIDFKTIKSFKIVQMPKTNLNDGKFFRFHNKTQIDLTRYQIYTELSDKNNYDNCLLYSLKTLGYDTKDIVADCIGGHIARNQIKKIAFKMGIIIKLRYYAIPKKDRTIQSNQECKYYGTKAENRAEAEKEGKPIVELGLIEDHYFIDEKIDYHMFAVENYEEFLKYDKDKTIYQMKNCKGYRYPLRKTEYSKSSFSIIKRMFEKDMFEPMSMEQLAKCQQYHMIPQTRVEITKAVTSCLHYNKKGELMGIEPKRYLKPYENPKELKENDQIIEYVRDVFIKENTLQGNEKYNILQKYGKIADIYFADIEAVTEGEKHSAFCCCWNSIRENKPMQSYAPDPRACLKNFLQYVKPHSIIYFHNLRYDISMVKPYIKIMQSTEQGAKIYKIKTTTSKPLMFLDSYKMITMPLAKFKDAFNLDVSKDLCPYDIYTKESILKTCLPLSEAEEYFKKLNDPSKTYEMFLEQCQNFIIDLDLSDENYFNDCENLPKPLSKLVKPNQTFKHLSYVVHYCHKDVEVLKKGMMIFSYFIRFALNMDIFQYTTNASLANDYFIHEGSYEGVLELSGMVRRFIQEAAWGGRVAIKDNKVQHINKNTSKLSKFSIKEKVSKARSGSSSEIELIDDFDGVALYPSSMYRIPGFPTGEPHYFEKEVPCSSSAASGHCAKYFIARIKLKSVNNWMDFQTFRIKKDDKILWPTKDDYLHCLCYENLIVDSITLEDMVKFNGVEYELIEGYWFEGFNNRINEVIKKIFDMRLKYKKEKNPLEQVMKLLMNSGYGSTLMKENKLKKIYFYDKEKADNYMNKNFNIIDRVETFPFTGKEYIGVENGKKIFKDIDNCHVMVVRENILSHFNRAHCGCIILSMSKRIVNEVFYTAHKANIPIYYTDTDSMHMKNKDIKTLSENYKKEFNRELIGKQMGQFHSDFSVEGFDDIQAVESIFISPKVYCDYLYCKNSETGAEDFKYHIRMKGISDKSILFEASKEFGGNVCDLFSCERIVTFDLLANNQVKFQFGKNIGVSSKREFTRDISFISDKELEKIKKDERLVEKRLKKKLMG